MRALHEAFIIATVLTVAVSGQALAGGKGGGGGGGGGRVSNDGPKGNISLNYGKIEHTYMSCTRFRRHRVRCFMEQEVRHGETAIYARVQA